MTSRDPKTPEDTPEKACHAEDTAEKSPPVRIGVVREKIGEGRDNLARRGEWFSRRSGGKK